jgi:hypothetical protein
MIGRVVRSWTVWILVGLVGLTNAPIRAQQGVAAASAEHSYAVQSQLQAIDQDRAAFVDRLLFDWAHVLDPNVYDVETELRPLMMKAPAWQLYGASLVGDFQTMVGVLTGIEGAAPYINAFEKPQMKTASASVANLLGSSNEQLVYTPIAPCRIVDTRGSGARTGILSAGATRVFDLTTDGYGKGQGGATSGCVGLPSYSYMGWAVNITVTAYSANGHLTVYPYGGTMPTASVINFGSYPYAIANGMNLTGCVGCLDDINVYAAADTHVIIDVTGYFQNANVGSAAMSRVAGTAVPIAAAAKAFVSGGACPAGTLLIGGEVDHSGSDVAEGEDHQDTSTTWTFWMINNDASSRSVTAYSRCMDTPIRVY